MTTIHTPLGPEIVVVQQLDSVVPYAVHYIAKVTLSVDCCSLLKNPLSVPSVPAASRLPWPIAGAPAVFFLLLRNVFASGAGLSSRLAADQPAELQM